MVLKFILSHFISLVILLNIFLAANAMAFESDEQRAIRTVSEQLYLKIKKSDFYKDLRQKTKISNSKKTKAQDVQAPGKTQTPSDTKKNTPVAEAKNEIKSKKVRYDIDILKQKGTIDNPNMDMKTTVQLKSFERVTASVENKVAILKVNTQVDYDLSNQTWKASVRRNFSNSISSEVSTDSNSEVRTGVFFRMDF